MLRPKCVSIIGPKRKESRKYTPSDTKTIKTKLLFSAPTYRTTMSLRGALKGRRGNLPVQRLYYISPQE